MTSRSFLRGSNNPSNRSLPRRVRQRERERERRSVERKTVIGIHRYTRLAPHDWCGTTFNERIETWRKWAKERRRIDSIIKIIETYPHNFNRKIIIFLLSTSVMGVHKQSHSSCDNAPFAHDYNTLDARKFLTLDRLWLRRRVSEIEHRQSRGGATLADVDDARWDDPNMLLNHRQ